MALKKPTLIIVILACSLAFVDRPQPRAPRTIGENAMQRIDTSTAGFLSGTSTAHNLTIEIKGPCRITRVIASYSGVYPGRYPVAGPTDLTAGLTGRLCILRGKLSTPQEEVLNGYSPFDTKRPDNLKAALDVQLGRRGEHVFELGLDPIPVDEGETATIFLTEAYLDSDNPNLGGSATGGFARLCVAAVY